MTQESYCRSKLPLFEDRGPTMTEPTNAEKARYIVERTEGCWHYSTSKTIGAICSCQKVSYNIAHAKKMNPTFTDPAGRIQLLELIVKAGLWKELYSNLPWSTIVEDYLLDNTGLLLDAAYRFLKEEEI
jgi:hypothetical protein